MECVDFNVPKATFRQFKWSQSGQNKEVWEADRLVIFKFWHLSWFCCRIFPTSRNTAPLHVLHILCYNKSLLTTILYLFIIVLWSKRLILAKNHKKNRCVSLTESQVIYEGSYCAHLQWRTDIDNNTHWQYAYWANVIRYSLHFVCCAKLFIFKPINPEKKLFCHPTLSFI